MTQEHSTAASKAEQFVLRPITAADDPYIAAIIRDNLRKYHLDIPGTAYFDPELDHLSTYYAADPEQRFYFILTDAAGSVVGGAGLAFSSEYPQCAELQKLYLCDRVKGQGLGIKLMQAVERKALELGYCRLYLETHTNLQAALCLYEKLGFRQVGFPKSTPHTTMNRFYLKDLAE